MKIALIVAGGSGSRMQSDYPKQFLLLGGKPILMHTIECFIKYSNSVKIIVVLPDVWKEEWLKLVKKHNFQVSHEIVSGGLTRTESVQNGLEHVESEDLVAIHDGVRPFASVNVITEAFRNAEKFGNAVVAVKLKESIRQIKKGGGSTSVSRDEYRLIQTPQVFKGSIIKKAYGSVSGAKEEFTDDASLAEFTGQEIHLVEGRYENIKITTPEDLILAESILKSRMGQ